MVAVNNRVQEHTVECSTSSTLCKPGFKQSCEGTDSDPGKVLVVNNSDVDLPADAETLSVEEWDTLKWVQSPHLNSSPSFRTGSP